MVVVVVTPAKPKVGGGGILHRGSAGAPGGGSRACEFCVINSGTNLLVGSVS